MRTPLALFVLALAVRAVAGLAFPEPAYPDSFYYVNVANALASGQGFHVDYIWNFVDVGGRLPADPTLPVPSNAHWMPLAAVVQVPFIWLLGAGPIAHGLPFWIAGALAAPLTYLIGRDASLSRGGSAAAAVLTALPGAATPFLSQPDNFGLFMTLGALALWLCGRGLRGDRRAFAAGGLVVGLATLSRSDGVLLGIPFALAFAVELVRRQKPARIGLMPAVACAAGFLVIAGPWLLRQLIVFGSLSPSAANGRILFIREYADLYSVSSDTSLSAFLAQGAGPLLGSRVEGLAMALLIFAGMPLLLYLAPFTLLGAWTRRADPLVRPWIVYAVTLFAFSGLLFAVHVANGTFLHSAVALLPHAYLLAVAGIGSAVTWVARRRSTWNARTATRIFTTGAVAFAAVAAIAGSALAIRRWEADRDVRGEIATRLAAVPAGDRVMSPDAGAYRFLTGRPGIVTPDDPLPVVEQALRAYGIRWLVLERDHIVPALAPLLGGEQRPAWLSEPLVVVEQPAGAAAGFVPPPPPGGERLPRAALYAVCLDVADPRCATTGTR